MTFHLDAGSATVIAAFLLFASSVWNTHKLGQVHTLVNSNFTEAKAARLAAEAALKTATELNTSLQQQLDSQAKTIIAGGTP